MYTGILAFLLGAAGTEPVDLVRSAGFALIFQGILWLIQVTIGGLMVRVLAAFGYYPRMAWWAFSYAIIAAVSPLTAVVMGADLLMASLVLTLSCLTKVSFIR